MLICNPYETPISIHSSNSLPQGMAAFALADVVGLQQLQSVT
jgi:hypothetical protein